MKKLFLPFILTTLILAACSTTTPTPSTTKKATPMFAMPTLSAAELTITDPSKPIEVTVGSEFTITVKTNSSPQLHWEIGKALDTNIVLYVWKDHVANNPNNTSDLSGLDVWRFKAVAPGQTTITLGYYQGDTENTSEMPVYTIVVK